MALVGRQLNSTVQSIHPLIRCNDTKIVYCILSMGFFFLLNSSGLKDGTGGGGAVATNVGKMHLYFKFFSPAAVQKRLLDKPPLRELGSSPLRVCVFHF